MCNQKLPPPQLDEKRTKYQRLHQNRKNREYMSKIKIPGVSFSWKRALGLTKLKQKISRKTGIPMSKSGMERKIGKTILNMIFKK